MNRPATALLHSATPKRYSGSVAGRNADSVLPKLFSGEKDLAKPRLILFLHFVRAEEGSGEESARAILDFLGGGLEQDRSNISGQRYC